jgi:hypothetical protein
MARRTMKSEARKSIIAGIQLVVLGTLIIMLAKTCSSALDDTHAAHELTPEQRAEVIGRLDHSPLDREQHIEMADRILNKRVEGNWREKR